jgi:putative tricarboxylic transport membrane protein
LIFFEIKETFVVFVTAIGTLMKKLTFLLLLHLVLSPPSTFAFEPVNPECLAPAKQGGGIYLTCDLATTSLFSANLLDVPMTINFKPGGIGAVAYNYVVGVRNDDPEMIIAASSGSALNLAIKKFGSYDVDAVRWLGAIGADYGMIAVRANSPWNNLDDLIAALRDKQNVIIGGGGSIGSQDWMKIALLMKEAAIDPKTIKYVAFEGGGEALSAFPTGYIDVFSGDVSEVHGLLEEKKIKVLAVLAPERLPGEFISIPTAIEQGYPIDWRIWRGFYMGPNVSDEAYNWWVNTFRRLVKTEEFESQRKAMGLYPFFLVGDEFNTYVRATVKRHHQTAIDIGLINE